LFGWLNKNCLNCKWKDKINILCSIIEGLYNIHKQGFVHKDFHSGNLLIRNIIHGFGADIFISDMGLSGPAMREQNSDEIYGVMPYLPPEVLKRKPYTQAADIYALGMIIYGFVTGRQPFDNVAHDCFLSIQIQQGKRPEISKEMIPEFLYEIIQQCWDQDPLKRPTSEQLYNLSLSWGIDSEIRKLKEKFNEQLQKADEYLSKQDKQDVNIITHPQAKYTSSSIPFTDEVFDFSSMN
jgi:serine/threonine protein kinase